MDLWILFLIVFVCGFCCVDLWILLILFCGILLCGFMDVVFDFVLSFIVDYFVDFVLWIYGFCV